MASTVPISPPPISTLFTTGSISHMDLSEKLEATETRALFTWNNNIAASSPDQKTPAAAHCKANGPLLQVTIDLFQTDTARLRRLRLAGGEFSRIRRPRHVLFQSFRLCPGGGAEATPGEALPNQEIFRRLAGAMGLTDPELFEVDRQIIETLLDPSKTGASTSRPWRRQAQFMCRQPPPYSSADHKYQTPSGKIEIAGERDVAGGITVRAGTAGRSKAAPEGKTVPAAFSSIRMANEQQFWQRPEDIYGSNWEADKA